MVRVRRAPGELVPGDVVELDNTRFEVVGEPFLGMVGGSPFDHQELFWRARVRSLEGAGNTGYVTWAVDDAVVLETRHRTAEAHKSRRRP